jgi:hypothetical protein
MPLVPGLSPSIRQLQPEAQAPAEVIVEAEGTGTPPNISQSGAILKIEGEDGSITLSLDGRSLVDSEERERGGWFDNLVDDIDDMELSRISDDLIRGVNDDMDSRKDWIEERAQGIKLLGLKIEIPNLQGATDGAPVEGMSRVRHPLLQEAVLRFQANARSELLPTDGPVKIRNDNNNANLQEDQLANALERDLNHYLTVTATEYYPDTDRMLLMLGFGGTAFKKVYYCPLRNRPVSETVDAIDLIVNNAATDLSNAKRITHRTFMRQSTVRRLQLLGVYRDVDLSTAAQPKLNAVQEEKNAVQGVTLDANDPEDRDREIYECYCELNIKGFEHRYKGKDSGLEVPYRVTIDVSSKKILSITRNYDEDDKELPEARKVFVKYTFVPGFGFYDIGLLHILGNTTNAITAAWRELLDAGMYSNFPGFLMADTGARQNTNIFRVPPGGGALVKTGGLPINQAIMPLPYQGPSPALMQLVDNMSMTGQRVGGTSELQVGEGRPDAPVGTTLAMIEQATKILNAVHKRMHAAQAEEFRLLVNVFRDHPDSFWQRNKKPARQWDEMTFIQALTDCELTPQADPNTASHAQRVMKIMALKQLQQANPSMYDPIAIDTAALQAIGWSNPEQFLAPPTAQQAPPPELQFIQSQIAAAGKTADAKMIMAQAKMADVNAKMGGLGAKGGVSPEELALKTQTAATKDKQVEFQLQRAKVDDENRDKDRDKELELERMRLLMEEMRNTRDMRHDANMQAQKSAAEEAKQVREIVSEHVKHVRDLASSQGGGE